MRILISGSHGLLGSALVPVLRRRGDAVVPLVRSAGKSSMDAVHWDVDRGTVDTAALEGFDAVIHLAGENLAGGRWSDARKARIRNSRVQGTQLLSEALAQLRQRPAVMLAASAVGYYGSRGDEILDEQSNAGAGYLASVCEAWEAAAGAAVKAGIRVVHLRFGVVLTGQGGALAKMLPAFRWGLGGRLGTGNQYWSWISLVDAISAMEHTLRQKTLVRAVNLVAPNPATNREFTAALSHVLHRPACLPVPAFALRLALGEMADAALLSSIRAVPDRLLATGFRFQYPILKDALQQILFSE